MQSGSHMDAGGSKHSRGAGEPTSRPAGMPQGVVLASMALLPVIATLAIVPVVPEMGAHFASSPRHQFLVPLLITLPNLFLGILAIPCGLLAERVGRKRTLLIALLVCGVAGVAPMGLDSLIVISVSRAVLGIGLAAVITASTMMLADLFEGDERRRWLAAQAGVSGLGAIGIFAVSGVLGQVDWRLPFAELGLAFVFVPLAWRLLSEPLEVETRATAGPAELGANLWIRFGLCCGLTVLGGANALLLTIESGYILGVRGVASAATIGYIGASAGMAAALGSLAVAFLAGRSYLVALISGFLCMSAGFLVTSASHTVWGAIVGMMVHGFGAGQLLPTLLTWALSLLPATLRGRGTGLWQSALFVGQFLSPLEALLLTRVSGTLNDALVYASLISAVIAVALLGVLGRASRKPNMA